MGWCVCGWVGQWVGGRVCGRGKLGEMGTMMGWRGCGIFEGGQAVSTSAISV